MLVNYDMVIHLMTSAGNKGYSLDNNKARYESEEEAIKLDRRTMSCWIMHDNLHIVESTVNFEDKLNNVLELVHSCLGDTRGIKKREKIYNYNFCESLV